MGGSIESRVAGWSTTAAGHEHAFRTEPNAPIDLTADDLGTLGGAMRGATGINSSGQVVGGSDTADGHLHAFLDDSTGMHDLNTLIPAHEGWTLPAAMSIDDIGNSVGVGRYQGQWRGFLLSPAPVTLSCSLP
jgi:probable HAF family extracellular repeat protein